MAAEPETVAAPADWPAADDGADAEPVTVAEPAEVPVADA